MSSAVSTASDWLVSLGLASKRLLDARGIEQARPEQVRLLSLLLVAPFVLCAMVAQAATTVFEPSVASAAVCGTFAVSWLSGLLVIERVNPRIVAAIAITVGGLLIGVSVGVVGGMATPLASMLIAVPVEAYRISHSRNAVALGCMAALTAFVATSLLVPAETASASPWYWATPLLYAAVLALRWRRQGEFPSQTADKTAPFDIDLIDAAVLHLGGSGEVESIRGRGRAMLNVDPSLLLGTGLFERVHVADRVLFLCAVSEARQRAAGQKVELRIRRAADLQSGMQGGYSLFELELVCSGTCNNSLWAVLRDAGQVAELRSELEQAVEHANAIEVAKGRFLATVSHELRTPLNAIIGFSDMLLHRDISGDLTPKQSEHVGLIREAGNHLLSVVNAILDISKIESGSYQIAIEPFDLKPAVDLCCAMLEPQAAASGVTLSARIPSGVPQIMGDQRAVQQMLLNLLSNAIKFTPKGGSVTVTAVASDRMVRLFVNDTGIGIAADDLAKLGRPFVQVQNDYTRNFQGTGLGLSLVKGLVRLHGGVMSIESAPGLGTTVTIGLPNAKAGKEDGHTEKWKSQGEDDGTALRRIA